MFISIGNDGHFASLFPNMIIYHTLDPKSKLNIMKSKPTVIPFFQEFQ